MQYAAWRRKHADAGHSCRLVIVTIDVGGSGRGSSRAIGGLGSQLEADGRNVGEPALASALIEPELDGQLGDSQQGELLGSGVLGWTRGHSDIIAKGCDTVVG